MSYAVAISGKPTDIKVLKEEGVKFASNLGLLEVMSAGTKNREERLMIISDKSSVCDFLESFLRIQPSFSMGVKSAEGGVAFDGLDSISISKLLDKHIGPYSGIVYINPKMSIGRSLDDNDT